MSAPKSALNLWDSMLATCAVSDAMAGFIRDTVWVSVPAVPEPWWQTLFGIANSLGTLAAALAAIAALYYAKQERDRATRAEKALQNERQAGAQALRRQVAVEAYAMGGILDEWLGGSPWEGTTLKPGAGPNDFNRWLGELTARRPTADAHALNLVGRGDDLPIDLQGVVNQVFVKYQFAFDAVSKARDAANAGDRVQFGILVILAEHAVRTCRNALVQLLTPDLRHALEKHVQDMNEDELSKQRGAAIQVAWRVHGP